MAVSIADLFKFKQEINQTIDECIESIKENDYDNNNNNKRLILQIMTYYDRMKSLYSVQQSSDDEDETFVSDDSDDDYTKLLEGRVYTNPNNLRDPELIKHEQELRKKLLGLSPGCSMGYPTMFDEELPNVGLFDDNSTDPTIYVSNGNEIKNEDEMQNENTSTSEEESEDEEGDCIINNTRKTLKTFIPDPDLEIITEDTTIDYNEPDLV